MPAFPSLGATAPKQTAPSEQSGPGACSAPAPCSGPMGAALPRSPPTHSASRGDELCTFPNGAANEVFAACPLSPRRAEQTRKWAPRSGSPDGATAASPGVRGSQLGLPRCSPPQTPPIHFAVGRNPRGLFLAAVPAGSRGGLSLGVRGERGAPGPPLLRVPPRGLHPQAPAAPGDSPCPRASVSPCVQETLMGAAATRGSSGRGSPGAVAANPQQLLAPGRPKNLALPRAGAAGQDPPAAAAPASVCAVA